MESERALGELSIEGKVWEGQATGVKEGVLRTMPVASRAGQEGMGSPGHRRSWEPECPSSAFQFVHKFHKVQKGWGSQVRVWLCSVAPGTVASSLLTSLQGVQRKPKLFQASTLHHHHHQHLHHLQTSLPLAAGTELGRNFFSCHLHGSDLTS